MRLGGVCCWVAGVLLAFLLPAAHFVAIASALALLLALIGCFRRARGAWWLLCGLLYGVWRVQLALSQQWPAEPEFQRVRLDFQVASVAEASAQVVRFEAWAQTEAGERFRLLVSDRYLREWRPGSRWRMTVRVRPTVGERNENGFDREAWALSRHIDGMASAARERAELPPDTGWPSRWQNWRYERQQAWQQAAETYPNGAALMRALGGGGYGGLADEHWQAFRVLGINHLISVSGLHIGMVALAAAYLARLLLLRLPLAEPRRWYLAAGLAAALFYSALAGFGVPIQRSLLMLAVFAWQWYRRGSPAPWRAWWQALAAVLLFDPLSALGVGFWFSFGAVAALIWAAQGRLEAMSDDDAPEGGWLRAAKHSGKWRTALRAQYAATLLGFWQAGQVFGTVPLAAPLANALLIPWFSWVLVPLALLAVLLPFEGYLKMAAAIGEHTMSAVVWAGNWMPTGALAHLPPLFWLAVLAALAVWLLPRGLGLRPWAALVLAASCLYRTPAPEHGTAAVRIIDVGQGLALQVRTQNHWLLFDAGTVGAAQTQLVPNLLAQGLPPPDVLVLSHHDADHDGGFPAVQAAFAPRKLYAGQPEAYTEAAQWCAGGTAWEWDGVYFEFLTPPHNPQADDNEQSCVLRVLAGGQAVLAGGDLGIAGERWLVGTYGDSLHSQLLVLGHHGSRSSSDSAYLNAVAPEAAVAANGFANPYGHPAAIVRHRLSAHGIALYTTARQGQMDFLLGAGREMVPQLQPKRFWQRKPFGAGA